MFEDDEAYFKHRAEVETERAQKATMPEVARVHQQLAAAYLENLAASEPSNAEMRIGRTGGDYAQLGGQNS